MHFFVDTSALAKRYIHEAGSNWVRSWILPKFSNTIIISHLTSIEFISLLLRRQREKSVSTLDVQRARNNFLAHVRQQYLVIEIDSQIVTTARRLITRHPLRTLDAVQLASGVFIAHQLNLPLTFVSADTRLLAAASAEGLAIDDPNTHP